MKDEHKYNITLTWTGNKGSGTSGYRAYARDYDLTADGKPVIPGSSDPAFLGDPSRHNPEDLFLASVASCHMLWFLHLASSAGIVVTSYSDVAEGFMKTRADGSGEFTSIVLRPHVTITDKSKTAEAEALHHKVGDLCFIARSIKTPIEHDVTVVVDG